MTPKKTKNPNEGPEWILCQNCGCKRPESQLSERLNIGDGGLESKMLACNDRSWCDRTKKERLAQEN